MKQRAIYRIRKQHSDDSIYKERLLIKWYDSNYVHLSQETEYDLLEQIESAKTLIKTFLKREFFDPALTQIEIERILEIYEPEQKKIIMDVKHSDYENGTSRQFLIKQAGSDYVEAKFEFERDLILNDVEYEEHVQSFFAEDEKTFKY